MLKICAELSILVERYKMHDYRTLRADQTNVFCQKRVRIEIENRQLGTK